MSILVLSVSHRTASMSTLAELALDPAGTAKLTHALTGSEHLDEVVVLSTCNRTEIYAAVTRFHAGLDDLTRQLSLLTGVGVTALTDACAVYYDEGAVGHTFNVAAGLDSLVIGESQILGQVRSALTRCQHEGTVGTILNGLFQQAIRVGKRVQSETGIGGTGRSLVSAALDRLAAAVGPIVNREVLVLGAGSIAALAAHTAADLGAQVTCVNRTNAKADRLAARVGGQSRPWADRAGALRAAEIVIACTGARAAAIGSDDLGLSGIAVGQDPSRTRLLGVIDLALPADVDPAVGSFATLVNLDTLLAADDVNRGLGDEIEQAHALVRGEVADFLAARRAAQVTPTVVALRSMASEVTAAELTRLDAKLPDLSEHERDEVTKTVRRVVDKLLHSPTVRVQQYADAEVDYAAALRELFALDPQTIARVIDPPVTP